MPPKSTLVVPLYIYPLTAETWAPLYAAIESHPTLPFLIIINPNSGPGDTESPDENYTREILRLNRYPNVTNIGYVRIDYCRRPLPDVVGEIERYAGWSRSRTSPKPRTPVDSGRRGNVNESRAGRETSALGMRGIFVDETPNHFDAEKGLYLAEVRRVVKEVDGILGGRLVVHNPGTAPDAALAATHSADLTVICEEPYHHYRSEDVQNWLGLNPMARDQAGYMVSGVPAEKVQELVRELRHRSGYVFVTDTEVDFYESFGVSWAGFVRAMQEED